MSFEEVQSTQLYPEDAKHYIPAQQKLSRPLKGWMGCDRSEHQEILDKILCIFVFLDIL